MVIPIEKFRVKSQFLPKEKAGGECVRGGLGGGLSRTRLRFHHFQLLGIDDLQNALRSKLGEELHWVPLFYRGRIAPKYPLITHIRSPDHKLPDIR